MIQSLSIEEKRNRKTIAMTQELFVLMPVDRYVRVFELPTFVYDSIEEAKKYVETYDSSYQPVTLQDAFDRIAKDIHEDS